MVQPGGAPTHLLHLVDAVSRPVIFGLLLKDGGHSLRPRVQPHAQPPSLTSLTFPTQKLIPSGPDALGVGNGKN